jgi:hypothetical protein
MCGIRLLARVLALVLTISATAFADDYEAILGGAVAARDRALETQAPKDWRQALEGFRRAAELKESNELRFEIARALAGLGLEDQALEAYRDLLGKGLNERAERVARAYVDSVAPRMAGLNVDGPRGGVVYVRSEKRAELPLVRPLVVVPGVFEVRVERAGERPWVEKIDVPLGSVRTLRVGSEPETPPARAGDRPPAVEKEPAQTADSAPGWPKSFLFVGTGAMLASGTVIVVTSLALKSERAALDESCPERTGDTCPATSPGQQDAAQEHVDAIATQKTVRTAGYVGLGVGVTAALVGLYGLLFAEAPSRAKVGQPRVRLSESAVALEWSCGF